MKIESKKDVISILHEYLHSEICGVYLYTMEKEIVIKMIEKMWIEDLPDNFILFSYNINGLDCKKDFKPYQVLKNSSQSIEKSKDINFVFELFKKWRENQDIIIGVIFEDINDLLEHNIDFKRNFSKGISDLYHNEFHFYIVSEKPIVPDVIEKKVFYIDVPLPSNDEIREILEKQIQEKNLVITSNSLKERIINALYGLTEEEIRDMIQLIAINGKIYDEDIIKINNMKKQIIKKGGVLEFVIPEDGLSSMGGFDILKEWIKRKKKIVDDLESAKKYGVDIPKGIMLFGMPGCGKSLGAKAIASELGIPLLRLDMGLILGPYVGQSEENIRKAIKQAESIAPCVLWIDEIEKAFAGIGGEGGSGQVTTRIFGTLLTWMQERSKMVFVIATANDITNIPPEFLRKGRFDEIFFVDFPDLESRKEILKIHLKKRKKEHWIDKINVESIAQSLKNGCSGADIEAIVSIIVEESFLNETDEPPSKDFIDRLLKDFKSTEESMKDKIKKIREICKNFDFKSASSVKL